MSGCNTTSALFNQGKIKFLNVLKRNSNLADVIHIFQDSQAAQDNIVTAGEAFLKALYGLGKSGLMPMKTLLNPATVVLLRLISYKCKRGSLGHCGYRKARLHCSLICVDCEEACEGVDHSAALEDLDDEDLAQFSEEKAPGDEEFQEAQRISHKVVFMVSVLRYIRALLQRLGNDRLLRKRLSSNATYLLEDLPLDNSENTDVEGDAEDTFPASCSVQSSNATIATNKNNAKEVL
ncbi:hypothetical protein ILUMI_18982 [Ignelater luminosus]|uniref:Uncharacterized protein n=1 Tax=Ignelater luminosus TaxID=2038154 RepID=A0A8K0G609_IGNLU|nr:hypothetical protein ILUMI_18982 [Ignelater luminosus]